MVIRAGKMSGLSSGQPNTVKLDELDVICAVLGCGVGELLLAEPAAMFNLGLLLEDSDPGQARRWWEKAAEAGHVGAMFNLGVLLRGTATPGRLSSGTRRRPRPVKSPKITRSRDGDYRG
jgi:TPR repeat protein